MSARLEEIAQAYIDRYPGTASIIQAAALYGAKYEGLPEVLPKEPVPSTPLKALRLEPKVKYLLERFNIETVEQLRSLDDQQLLEIHYFGLTSLEQVRRHIAKYDSGTLAQDRDNFKRALESDEKTPLDISLASKMNIAGLGELPGQVLLSDLSRAHATDKKAWLNNPDLEPWHRVCQSFHRSQISAVRTLATRLSVITTIYHNPEGGGDYYRVIIPEQQLSIEQLRGLTAEELVKYSKIPPRSCITLPKAEFLRVAFAAAI